MAASPRWKVYDINGVYQASCREVEAAAALIANIYGGGTIRDGHSFIVWNEDAEDFPAGESYDGVALVVQQRIEARKATR